MAFTLGNFSNALQVILLPYIRDNFPKATILLDQMKRNAGVQQMNNNFYAPLRNSRHGGVANLASDGNTTVSGTAGVSQASVGVKIFTGVFDITKLAIDASKSTKLAVTPALQFEAESLASDFARSVNRQMYSDGVGVIAQVQVAGTTGIKLMVPDANCGDGRSVDWYGSVNGDVSPTKYIAPGMHLGFATAAGSIGTVASVAAPTSSAYGSVTMNAGFIGTANDPVYIVDGSGAAAGTYEMQGIRAALSSSTGTSTYAGVARSTTGWTPQFGSVSEALTLSRMESSYLAAREYGQIGDQYIILVNKTLYKKYGDLLTSMRRSVNETDLLGGWTGLEFAAGAGKVGVFLDYDVPDGEVIILDLDTWTICQVSDLDWMESPNEGAMLRVANTIYYQATMVWFANLMCLAPAANGVETQKTA
jgi:hypothetical protein